MTQARRRLAIAGAVLAFVVLAGAARIAAHLWEHKVKEPGRAGTGPPFDSGGILIAALEAHKAAHGHYPPALGPLVPRYLASIPEPGWGENEWNYWPGSGWTKFGLEIWDGHNHFLAKHAWGYDSTTGRWTYYRAD